MFERRTITAVVPVTTALNTTPPIGLRGQADGRLGIPAGSAITALTFYDALERDGTYFASQGDDGPVTLTVEAGKSYPLPEALVAAAWIKIVANAAGSIHLTLKS